MTKKKITNKEAIERLKEHICAISLYVTEAKLDEGEVENELLNIEALEMAINALQFQDIMVNNPKSAKPTPEVCKNCKDNTQDDWIPVSEGLPEEYDQYLCYCEGGDCYVYWLDNKPWAERNVEEEEIIAWKPLPAPYKESEEE